MCLMIVIFSNNLRVQGGYILLLSFKLVVIHSHGIDLFSNINNPKMRMKIGVKVLVCDFYFYLFYPV